MRAGLQILLFAALPLLAACLVNIDDDNGHHDRDDPDASNPLGVVLSGSVAICPPEGFADASTDVEWPDVGDDVEPPGNVLLIILDEVGVDKFGAYHESPDPPPTPTLDALAEDGVLFRNAYAYPSCSATRASILTGRYGRRYGLGTRLNPHLFDYELPLAAVTIPEMLRFSPFDWDAGVIGKWHLATFSSASNLDHPRRSGFAFHEGSFSNLSQASVEDGQPLGYHHWEKLRDGVPSFCDRYATTQTVDDAIERIRAMQSPWFLWLAFNAAHDPYGMPPNELLESRPPEIITAADAFNGMIEAMDAEIGRLLASIDPDVLAETTVIVIGDNGTPNEFLSPIYGPGRGKGSVYEGGVNVPLVVTGPLVSEPGREVTALVHSVDLFATTTELAGVPAGLIPSPCSGGAHEIDGISLLPYLRDPDASPQRRYLYVENFEAPFFVPPEYLERDERAVRDDLWKLLRFADGSEAFFSLVERSDDGPNLLERPLGPRELEAYDRLGRELDRLTGEIVFQGF